MAQFLHNGLGYSPLEAGLRLLPWAAPPLVMMPVAGKLADRLGNRPLMAGGLTMQAAGLAWLAAPATPGLAYWEIAAALAAQSIGTSSCFPTVANAAPRVGPACPASLFARHGACTSPAVLADGFRTPMWGAVAFSVAGAAAALCTTRQQPPQPEAMPASETRIQAA